MSGSGSRVERPDYVKRSAEKGVCHCCHARLGTGARRGVHYRDERACCERCRASAVTRITEGRPILQRVARDLKDLAGLDFEGGQWIRLELRSQTQLVEAGAVDADSTRLVVDPILHRLPPRPHRRLSNHSAAGTGVPAVPVRG